MGLGEPVKTEDGSFTLRHPEHGECYHSYDGAAKEARDLYIERSGFESYLSDGVSNVSVLDVGLGLAYNALTTVDAWMHHKKPANLFLLSLEISEDLVEALCGESTPWAEGWSDNWHQYSARLTKITEEQEVTNLKASYPFAKSFYGASMKHPVHNAKLDWLVIVGDARRAESFAQSGQNHWDFIWQDPFSPEKNPLMWNGSWFNLLKKESHRATALMTYSVSRATKNALTEGGWEFEKVDTTTRKRHWIKAKIKS